MTPTQLKDLLEPHLPLSKPFGGILIHDNYITIALGIELRATIFTTNNNILITHYTNKTILKHKPTKIVTNLAAPTMKTDILKHLFNIAQKTC